MWKENIRSVFGSLFQRWPIQISCVRIRIAELSRLSSVSHMVEQLSMLQPADQIDFILLFTDITSMMSVLSTKADTETIHPLFASGRTCFVVTHGAATMALLSPAHTE